MTDADKILAQFPNASESFKRRLLAGKPLGVARSQEVRAMEIGAVGLPKTPGGKRLRQSAGHGLNKLETAAWEHLQKAFAGRAVIPHGLTLTLGNGVKYTPDFVVRAGAATLCYEVKGPVMRDDAAVKLKISAHEWPAFTFTLLWREGRGGPWCEQLILP